MSPGQVVRWVTVITVGAAVAAVAMVAVRWGGFGNLPLPAGPLTSLHLPDPVELTVGRDPVRVSRFALDMDRLTLTLEQDQLAFNDYGDATRTGGPEPRTIQVRFQREEFNRFEVVADVGFRPRLRLVVPRPHESHCRLIPFEDRDGRSHPDRILELRGPEVVHDELGDRPQPDRFSFTADGSRTDAARPYRVKLTGSLSAGGALGIDPNVNLYDPDGTVSTTTLLGWEPAPVTFQTLGPDPAGRGRRAFEVVPEGGRTGLPPGRSAVLVLGPTELSQHLLLVKAGGRVRQALPLRNPYRDNFRDNFGRLGEVPDDERSAYRELGGLTDYRARTDAADGHVYTLDVTGDLGRLDPLLPRFTELRQIGFTDATLPPEGLPSLERLKRLEGIHFHTSVVSDEGLASVGRLTWLKGFGLYGSGGLTAAGLAHLTPLTRLESLSIRRDDGRADGPAADDGLRHLAGMTGLRSLDLTAQPVTDAGLAHIGKLVGLREIALNGSRITDAGLRHLDGLPLQRFRLEGPPGASWAAVEAFRDRLPNRGHLR